MIKERCVRLCGGFSTQVPVHVLRKQKMCFPRKRTATQLVASTACPIPPPPFPVPRECVADALILLSVVSLKQTFPFLLSFPLLFVPSSSSSLLVEKETEASQTPRFPAATFQSHWCLCGRKRKRSRTPFLVLFFFFFLTCVSQLLCNSVLLVHPRCRAPAPGLRRRCLSSISAPVR